MNKKEEEQNNYLDFLKKFDKKKTTDDCYTPQLVYLAVQEWVSEKYGKDPANFVRPFFPGGDYTDLSQYEGDKVVVDNPPFSILSKILDFYIANRVPFFLFAPSLTMITTLGRRQAAAIITCNPITYDNKAAVNTSFLTNLEPPEVQVKSEPALWKRLKKANEDTLALTAQPRYKYPDQVMTANDFRYLTINGQEFTLTRSECEKISSLQSQKEKRKAIFGGGYILSSSATARLQQVKQEVRKSRAQQLEAEKQRILSGEKDAEYFWEIKEKDREKIEKLDQKEKEKWTQLESDNL